MEKEIPISQKMELGSLKDLLRLVVSIMGRSNQSGYLYYGEKDGKHVYFLTHTVGGWYELRGLPVTLIAFTEIKPETNFLEYSPPSNENEESYKFITTGLWAWSRHPNYFGEILLWFGVTIIAFPALQGLQLITIISPIFVTLLLTKISGINLLEKSNYEKWGDDEEFLNYMENTPRLIIRPPKKRN